MLKMNLNCEITNINYLRYMEHKDNENEENKTHYESERTTSAEEKK